MSDDERRRRTADASDDHLNDEELSAALDGEGAAGTDAHIASCSRCGARSATLASAQATVATPPPAPTAERRDAAVAAALDVAQGRAGGTATEARPIGDLAALRSRRRTRPRRDVGPWLGAAAVLALLVGAASILDLSGSDSDDAATSAVEDNASSSAGGDSSAAGEVSETEAADEEADRSAVAATAPDATVTEEEGADDRADVAEDADGAPEEEVVEAPGGVTEEEVTEEEARDGAGLGPIDVGDLGAIEPDADLTELTRLLGGDLDEANAGSRTSVAPAPADPRARPAGECLGEVRVALGITAPLALIGTATVDGAPATALGFDDGPDAGIRIAIVGVDCQVLAASPKS